MRLIIFFSYIFFLSCFATSAQEDLLETKQKIFTLKHARVSVGLGGELGGGSLVKFRGNLPENYNITRDTVSGPKFISATLYLDLNAPSSRLSCTSGVEWNSLELQIKHEINSEENNIRINHIQVPFFFKFRMGEKFSKGNVVIFAGGSYNIPISYFNTGNASDMNIIQNTYSWLSGIALQMNFRGKDALRQGNWNYKPENKIASRAWLYLKVSGMMTNLFDTQHAGEILNNPGNEEIEYRDLRYTIGLAFFLGSKKKHQVK